MTVFKGTPANDTIVGTPGDDILYGDRGDDHLDGGAGDDTVHGDQGRDVVRASLGMDQTWLGAGNDTLDVYLAHLLEPDGRGSPNYHTVELGIGTTLVHDFDPGHDKIEAYISYQASPSGAVWGIPDVGRTLDTNHDGLIGAGDREVSDTKAGLVIDLGRLEDDYFGLSGHEGQDVALLGLHGVPDDVFTA